MNGKELDLLSRVNEAYKEQCSKIKDIYSLLSSGKYIEFCKSLLAYYKTYAVHEEIKKRKS